MARRLMMRISETGHYPQPQAQASADSADPMAAGARSRIWRTLATSVDGRKGFCMKSTPGSRSAGSRCVVLPLKVSPLLEPI